MPITSGSIEYERRLNLGEYNHKNVVAKVSWTVEPNEDDGMLAIIAVDKVVKRVKDVLNWKPAVPAEVVLPGVPDLEPDIENIAAPDLATAVAEITAGIPPTLKRHRRTKAEMEAARAAAAEDAKTNRYGEAILPADPMLTPEAGTPITTPSSPEPPLSHGSVMDRIHAETFEPGMPSFDPDPVPPAEVTDQDLTDACQAKASSGTLTTDITALVTKFSPGRLFQTPKEARRRFLEELAKL